jgi:hypothetical protein
MTPHPCDFLLVRGPACAGTIATYDLIEAVVVTDAAFAQRKGTVLA